MSRGDCFVGLGLDTSVKNTRSTRPSALGFGWSTGPFETWQAAGWKQIAEWVQADIGAGEALAKVALPKLVFDGPVAKAGGVHAPQGSWSPSQKKFVARSSLPVYGKQLLRAPLAGETSVTGHNGGKTVFEDEAVRLWTLESGQAAEVLIFSIKTKVHAIVRASSAAC